MSLIAIPEQPLPILWQNTVVDIEATSRYPKQGETIPDTASINTTICLVNPQPEPQSVVFVAPGHHEAEASARELGDPTGVKAEEVALGTEAFDELLARLQALQQELQTAGAQAQELIERTKKFHRFQLELAPGGRIVRFFTRLPVIQEPDGTYKFSELVPRQFARLEGRADFSVVVFIPRNSEGYTNVPAYQIELMDWTKDPQPQVFGREELTPIAQRQAVAWYWRQDPVLQVIYRYK